MSPLEKLDGILKSYKQTGGDLAQDEQQQKTREDFLKTFPVERILSLDLESYCIGRQNKTNLCWWVERGTSRLSKYSPGSSKSYGVFWESKSQKYRFCAKARQYEENHKSADPERILKEVIVNPLGEFLASHGQNAELIDGAVGRGFLLKLLILYYPDEFIQINSIAWLDKVIFEFGLQQADSFVAKNKIVKKFYDEKRKLVSDGELTQGAFVAILTEVLGLRKPQFWHMQIHPTNNDPMQREDVLKLIRQYGFIGMGRAWKNDGGQPQMFQDDVHEGDVIGIRESGFVALVRVAGPCRENPKKDELCWFDIVRPVELLSDDAEPYIAQYRAEKKKGPHDNLYLPATLSPVKPQCKNKFLKFWYEQVSDVDDDEVEPDEIGEESFLYSKEAFLNEVYMTSEQFDEVSSLLRKKKNVILTGAPGVGKTFAAKRIAWAMMGEKDSSRIQFVQFHQSYSYEDFVCGYKPDSSGFKLVPGVFYDFCKTAEKDLGRPYFFIIDEINRGNLSKIFGELLMLIEADKRSKGEYGVRLAYKPDELFTVPANIHIIGMMNTADRSLALMDYALRRRFSFFPMTPGFDTDGFKAAVSGNEALERLVDAVKTLNKRISDDPALGSGYVIGHSYFCDDEADANEIVQYDIGPTLREYWFDNSDRAQHEIDDLFESLK